MSIQFNMNLCRPHKHLMTVIHSCIVSLIGLFSYEYFTKANQLLMQERLPLIQFSFFLLPFTDYESPLPIFNETEYQYQYHPYARNGFNFPHNRHTHDRPSSSYRLHQNFGNIITHSSDIGGIANVENVNNDNDRGQFDYNEDYNRESNVNFYDNKYYDNLKMHR